jgi:hypothetical protein
MTPDEEKTLAIAKRTRKNLTFMYNAKGRGCDVEEFTHLLNSMLSMVICLREEYFKGKIVTWDDVERKGLRPVIIKAAAPDCASPNLELHKNFSQLITKLRHGFSHNCFSLNGDVNKNITGVTIWTIPNNKENIEENRTWQASVTEQQLKDLSYLFIDYICKEFGG